MKINYQNNNNQNYNEANYLENILEPNLINYNNSIVDLFMKYIENKNSILDFGAGSGALASIIRNRLNTSPICIEIDSKLIMSLKKKGFKVHKDITDLKEKFDLIYSSKKNVELVLAKIYDIDDEDIQKEYMSAFNKVVYLYDELKEDYERQGFSDNSEELLTSYKNAFNLFESEFEI